MDHNQLKYHWTNCVDGFNMPLKIMAGNKTLWLSPTMDWEFLENVTETKLEADINFYIETKNASPRK
jgi:hypothetical protein